MALNMCKYAGRFSMKFVPTLLSRASTITHKAYAKSYYVPTLKSPIYKIISSSESLILHIT